MKIFLVSYNEKDNDIIIAENLLAAMIKFDETADPYYAKWREITLKEPIIFENVKFTKEKIDDVYTSMLHIKLETEISFDDFTTVAENPHNFGEYPWEL